MRQYLLALCGLGLLVVGSGCAGTQRSTPIAPVTVQANLNRSDYVVMDTVKGVSVEKKFLCGLFKVIDDGKVEILGIKFFKDKYSPYGDPGGLLGFLAPSQNAGADTRAYYNALQAHPDADNVLNRSWIHERTDIPLIYTEDTATFTGKAIKLRSETK